MKCYSPWNLFRSSIVTSLWHSDGISVGAKEEFFWPSVWEGGKAWWLTASGWGSGSWSACLAMCSFSKLSAQTKIRIVYNGPVHSCGLTSASYAPYPKGSSAFTMSGVGGRQVLRVQVTFHIQTLDNEYCWVQTQSPAFASVMVTGLTSSQLVGVRRMDELW